MANYEKKEKIERQKLKKPLLKRIIVRLDYTSIADMQKALNKVVGYLKPPKGFFNTFDQMNISIEPKQETETSNQSENKGPSLVYRFSGCTIEPKQEVVLDFARNVLCLDIHCNDQYEEINKYLDIMIGLMTIILKNEAFVQLNRIGIRKISGEDEITLKEADEIFEYFSQRLQWTKKDHMLLQQYTDQMFCDDVMAFVIYNRIVRYVPKSEKFRFTLDIDCYKEANQIERRPSKTWLEDVLYNKMNKKMFDLFKMGIKLEYFNKNL